MSSLHKGRPCRCRADYLCARCLRQNEAPEGAYIIQTAVDPASLSCPPLSSFWVAEVKEPELPDTSAAERESAYSERGSANRFFHDPDLCTLVNEVLVANIQAALPHAAKVCVTDAETRSLLAFRGVTRQSWEAVMLEHSTRWALNLTARNEATEGVLVYTDPNATQSGMVGAGQAPPFISHNKVDITALLAVETEDPDHHVRGGPRARMITHHRAATHQRDHYPPLEASLFISAEQYEICSTLPLACEMFLTQPPQKSIRFGIRYSHQPARRLWEYFEINNEQGIRFGDLIAHLTREPSLLKRTVDPQNPFKRWLSDSEFYHMVRITWEYPRAVVCERASAPARLPIMR